MSFVIAGQTPHAANPGVLSPSKDSMLSASKAVLGVAEGHAINGRQHLHQAQPSGDTHHDARGGSTDHDGFALRLQTAILSISAAGYAPIRPKETSYPHTGTSKEEDWAISSRQ